MSRPGPCGGVRRPGLTRTQALRQAKSAAIVRDSGAAPRAAACPSNQPKMRLSKLGPPPADPKKIDMKKPGLTKAMMARMAKAKQFQAEYEQKKQQETRKFTRTGPAPIGGDARFGRERRPKKRVSCPRQASPQSEAQQWQPQGALQEAAACSPTVQRLLKMKEQRMQQMKDRERSNAAGPARRRERSPVAGPSGATRARRSPSLAPVSPATSELARSMNADVVQADPVGDGPIESIIIPPGTVSECRTTIVNIPHTSEVDGSVHNVSSVANRSIQVINETLNEQDAAETAAVQDKLAELQQARREFVIAVANVGGNAVNIADQPSERRPRAPRQPVSPRDYRPVPGCVMNLPDVNTDPRFQVEYGLDHPDVEAARAYSAKYKAACEEREAQKKMEERFYRAADEGGLRMDVPFQQEMMEGDISFEEDEETGMIMPCPSRIKASMPPIPQKAEACLYQPFDADELERFFNVEKYPPAPYHGPPMGRENLHPDLWELDDPWYREAEYDGPDLIDFDTPC